MKVIKNGTQKSGLKSELTNSLCEVNNGRYLIRSNSFRNNW